MLPQVLGHQLTLFGPRKQIMPAILLLPPRDGDISWTVTSRGHYFSKWETSRGHSQRVTSRGHYFSKWVTSRGQF